jgi:preprotein translocase subunit SecG
VTAFLTVLHVLACLVLIVVVLLQRGKGAEIGAVFGGGASTTVFGGRGAGNFLTKITTGAVIIFFITSMSLSFLSTRQQSLFAGQKDVEQTAPAPAEKPAEETGGLQEVAPPAAAQQAAPGEAAPSPAATPEDAGARAGEKAPRN